MFESIILTVLLNMSTGEDVRNSAAVQINVPVSTSTYLWGSYGEGRQDRLTQRMGTVATYGGGIGLQLGNGFFAELGYLKQSFDSKPRVAREVAYHSFVNDFGVPPFADNWSQVEYLHEPDADLSFKIGYQHKVTERITAVVSYQHFQPNEYWRIWNPAFVVDGAEGGLPYPYWEGNRKVDNSSFQFGVRYAF